MSEPAPGFPPANKGAFESVVGVRLWTAAWLVLAVAHVTQAIWWSGFTVVPGDLVDGRFNALVLEHGYQALRGLYDFFSPGQFYPETGTLGLSDTHVGTLPIYAALRVVGCSDMLAWQGWFVIVAALNAWAASRWLGALGIAPALRGPLTFAASASAAMVWMAGAHAQLLPIFPALFAAEQAVRWSEDRARWRWLACAGWIGWQFAAGPYQTFFAAVLGAFAVVAAWALRVRPARVAPVVAGRRRDWAGAFAVAVPGLGLGVVAVIAYGAALRAGHSRGWAESLAGAPDLRAWFTAAPTHALYRSGWPGRHSDWLEHVCFTGFLPWAGLAAVLACGWRWRRDLQGRRALVFALAAVAAMLFFTRWTESGAGAWTWATRYVAPLRAFRASGRIVILLQAVEVAALGVVLSYLWTRARSRLGRGLLVICAVAVAAENLSLHPMATPVAQCRARRNALIAAWRAAGDRPILVYAPGPLNQHEDISNLDAWSAALLLRRHTVNGYNGSRPMAHTAFLLNMTSENALGLLARHGVPASEVSLVTALAPEAERAQGLVHQAQRSLPQLAGFSLQPVRWALFTDAAPFVVEGRTMYQLTPPAELEFAVPEGATRVRAEVALRPGCYDGDGNSDGVGFTWVLRGRDGAERVLFYEHLNPRDHAGHRGILPRELVLPPGAGRVLILRTDHGPAGDGAWDWPLVGNLRIE